MTGSLGKKISNLPSSDHFGRFVPWARVRKDADDNVIGILPHAYQRRDGEDALSVNWLERVEGDQENRIRTAAALINNGLKVGKKARLAISNVEQFKSVCKENGSSVRIVHDPEPGNEPHSSIRQIPRDDLVLLEAIVREAVQDHRSFGDLLK